MSSILIIDDDQAILDVLCEMLEQDDYEVRIAVGGVDGVQAYRDQPADVVITDLIMPKKDGVTVISELKNEFPGCRIIAMSGTPVVEKYSQAVSAEVNRIIIKPFQQEELLDAVAQLIDTPVSAPS